MKEVKNIKKEMNPKETVEKVQDDKETREDKDSPSSLEAKVVNGVLDQIPGVRKFQNIKEKAEKLEKIIK